MWLSTHFFQKIGEILFPEKCFGCGRTGTTICRKCLDSARFSWNQNEFEAPLNYDHVGAQKALWALKYHGMRNVAIPFGAVLHEHLLPLVGEIFEISPGREHPILIVPIPLHPARERERGYNQSLLLAQELARLSPHYFRVEAKVLSKTRVTKPQAQCTSKHERIHNLRDSFALSETPSIAGETIILLDDVVTTGSTMHEAERILEKGAPESIHKVGLMRAH